MLKIILAVGLSLALFGLESVLAASCEDFPPAKVSVNLTKTTVQERFDVTAADLQRAAVSSGIKPHWPALGAYTSDIAYAANIFENAQEAGKGFYCAAVASVQVELSLENRIIHLARELQNNRCLEEGQRQHLHEHARADAMAVQEFPVSELQDAIGKIQVSQAPSASVAKAQVTTAVHEQIKRLIDGVTALRTELNKKIDSPESIEHLQAQIEHCSAGLGDVCHQPSR